MIGVKPKLDYLIEIQSGQRITVEGLGETNVFSIGGEHIQKGKFSLKKNPFFLPEEFFDSVRKGRIEVNDTLMVKDGATIGKSMFVSSLPSPKMMINEHVFLLRPKQIEPRFLNYLIQSTQSQFDIWSYIMSAAQPGIGKGFAKKIEVSVLDPKLQTEISNTLDRETSRVDRLIEKKRRQIDLLREKEKSEISEIANRGIGQTDFSIDHEFPWRGKFPSGWKESRLKAHFRQAKRQGFEDLEVLSVYREFGVIEKSSRTDNNNKTPEDLSKYQLVEPGDLVINKMKAWQGSLGISRFRGIVSPDYVVMVPIGEHHPDYMHHLLRAKPMPNVYEQISNGIRLAQWRLETYKFLCLPLFLPEQEEQKEISIAIDRALKRSRAAQRAIKKSINLLLEKRAALITAAVTGQRDVLSSASVQLSANDNVPLLVAAEIIRQHERSQKFGRVKFQKIIYLAEAHCGVHEFVGKYQREAAGPLDRVLLNNLEGQLAETGLYRAKQADDGGAVTYKALASGEDKRNALSLALGDRANRFRDMLAKLRDMDTHAVEAVTTLYAVWNDFLIDGGAPDDRAIIQGVLEDWHPEKKDKFRAGELQTWLGWMRRNDFIPKGQGPRTSTGRLFV